MKNANLGTEWHKTIQSCRWWHRIKVGSLIMRTRGNSVSVWTLKQMAHIEYICFPALLFGVGNQKSNKNET